MMNDGEKQTVPTEPFALFDCSLARLAIGRSCSNLRDLLDALRNVPDTVLEHHMMRCALDDHFELYEFPNDLARWCWDALGDRGLAEQLGLVDPYQQPMATLRGMLVNLIEDRLWGLERVPWCRPGLELHLASSRMMAFDTGERLPTLAALAQALPRMSSRSLFYHVHEARRRSGANGASCDDFSAWLEKTGAEPALVARIRGVDFAFLNLNQLRQPVSDALRLALPEPHVPLHATA